MRHGIEFLDRRDDGIRHYRRWTATCVCGGWHAVPKRTKAEVAAQWREHRQAAARRARQGRRINGRGRSTWRPLTPVADLPEALRPLAPDQGRG